MHVQLKVKEKTEILQTSTFFFVKILIISGPEK